MRFTSTYFSCEGGCGGGGAVGGDGGSGGDAAAAAAAAAPTGMMGGQTGEVCVRRLRKRVFVAGREL